MPKKPPPPSRPRTGSRLRPESRERAAPGQSLVRMLPRLRVVRRQHTLIYGLRLLPDQILEEGAHVQVPLPHVGPGERLALHQIDGDVEEIRRRLQESLDAFFEIYGEELE